MSQSPRPRVGSSLFIVLSLSLALSALGFWRLWGDYRDFDGGSQGQEPFGKVLDQANSAQRKSSSAYSWDILDGGEVVYFGDTLQTGPASKLVVTDFKGRKVELEENSLVVVEKHSDLSLRFEQGRFFVFEKGKSEATAIEAQHGRVKREALGFRVDEPRILEWPLLASESEARIPVSVTLTGEGNAMPTLSIKTDSGKEKLVELKASAKLPNKLEGTLVLAEGQHRVWWRQGDRAVKNDLVRVWRPQALETISPRANEVIFGSTTRAQVEFAWTNPNPNSVKSLWSATHTVIEVSNPRSGATQNIETKGELNARTNLDAGVAYTWRLRTRLPDGREVASSKSNFRIEAAPALKALYPGPDGEKFLDWSKGPEIDFKYRIHESVSNDAELGIEFSSQIDFSNVELSHKLQAHSEEIKLLPGFLKTGSYFWRLTSKVKGSLVFATVPRPIQYGTLPPPDAPVFITRNNRRFVRSNDNPIRLELSAAERARNYEFSILPVEIEKGIRRLAEVDTAKVIVKKSNSPDLEITELPPGTYRALAYAVDKLDRKSSASKEITFVVDWGQALAAPKIRTKEAQ